jgi:hypothetical protein
MLKMTSLKKNPVYYRKKKNGTYKCQYSVIFTYSHNQFENGYQINNIFLICQYENDYHISQQKILTAEFCVNMNKSWDNPRAFVEQLPEARILRFRAARTEP